jgi:hypothetical protein
MNSDWQTIAALAVVGVTVVLLVRRHRRKRRAGGTECDCPVDRGITRKR